MGLIWDLWQHKQIGDASAAADTAASSAARASRDVTHIERRVERLALACQAMWELLSERTGVTEEELVQHMEAIDIRDGAVDGRMQSQVLICPTCKRRNNSRRPICMYCTHPIPRPHAFE